MLGSCHPVLELRYEVGGPNQLQNQIAVSGEDFTLGILLPQPFRFGVPETKLDDPCS